MSYILEALKKSQRDRDLGETPDLTTEPYTNSTESRSGINPWLISSVIIALIALLIALYGVFGSRSFINQTPEIPLQSPVDRQLPAVAAAKEQRDVSAQLPKPVSPAREEVEPDPRVADKPEPIKHTAAAEKKPATLPSRIESPATPAGQELPPKQAEVIKIRQEYAQMQAQEKQRVQEKRLARTRQQEQEVPATIPTAANRPVAETASAGKINHPAVHELPADVLARIPPRNVMLQSYSEDPAQRFVILNSVKLHQGERTTDGLQVLEIRTDGLVLGFEGHKFFRPR